MPTDLHRVVQTAEGTGFPIVIVHGAMDRSSSFGRVARRLRDLTVVRYDRRGYGSSEPGSVVSIDQHVDDLVSVIDGRSAVVLGHSIGGVIALMVAERRPDLVRAVVAHEPPTPWVSWWPTDPDADDTRSPEDEAERFMRSMVGERIWNRLPERTREARRSEGPAFRGDVDSVAGPDSPFDPGAIDQPVICSAGSDANWWHRRGAEELASSLDGGELRVIEGAGHGVHLTHPAALADLTRALHRSVSAG